MEYHIQVLWIKFKKAVLPIISQPMTILSAPKKIILSDQWTNSIITMRHAKGTPLKIEQLDLS
jgi:hypothetical protein